MDISDGCFINIFGMVYTTNTRREFLVRYRINALCVCSVNELTLYISYEDCILHANIFSRLRFAISKKVDRER